MIGRLTGKVTDEVDGAVLVDVGGVGYEVTAPLGTLGRAPVDDQGRTTLFIHTHVREEQLSLFGFASEAERHAFRMLIGVSSIGPKSAVNVLSALPARELAVAIAQKELTVLTRIPGIGKKTAERLLLELTDKLPVSSGAPLPTGALAAAKKSPSRGPQAEALAAALVRMGYKPPQADKAVTALGDRVETADMADLVREALAVLVR